MDAYHLVIAHLPAKPGHLAEVEAVVERMLARALQDEPGLLRYSVHRVPDASALLHVEVYASKAAFQAHLDSAHVVELQAVIGEHLSGEIVVTEGVPVVLFDDPRTSVA
jgi:quinol monooxygenase YgiN